MCVCVCVCMCVNMKFTPVYQCGVQNRKLTPMQEIGKRDIEHFGDTCVKLCNELCNELCTQSSHVINGVCLCGVLSPPLPPPPPPQRCTCEAMAIHGNKGEKVTV